MAKVEIEIDDELLAKMERAGYRPIGYSVPQTGDVVNDRGTIVYAENYLAPYLILELIPKPKRWRPVEWKDLVNGPVMARVRDGYESPNTWHTCCVAIMPFPKDSKQYISTGGAIWDFAEIEVDE